MNKVEIEQKPESAVFHFNMGVLKTAEINSNNQLFINGYEKTKWQFANTNYNKKENLVAQKKHLQNPFYTGDNKQPILTASKCLDGRIFLRLYRNEDDLETMRTKAIWVGSYWKGKVYQK